MTGGIVGAGVATLRTLPNLIVDYSASLESISSVCQCNIPRRMLRSKVFRISDIGNRVRKLGARRIEFEVGLMRCSVLSSGEALAVIDDFDESYAWSPAGFEHLVLICGTSLINNLRSLSDGPYRHVVAAGSHTPEMFELGSGKMCPALSLGSDGSCSIVELSYDPSDLERDRVLCLHDLLVVRPVEEKFRRKSLST